MKDQFNFSSESAAKVLNYIGNSIYSYTEHGKNLYSDTLINRNNGRIEALKDLHDFLTKTFEGCGLEILELETEDVEEVEEEVQRQPSTDAWAILGNAFSHFSK
jgi:predicted nucleic acid-binding protein